MSVSLVVEIHGLGLLEILGGISDEVFDRTGKASMPNSLLNLPPRLWKVWYFSCVPCQTAVG
jgi:hypothetical protein